MFKQYSKKKKKHFSQYLFRYIVQNSVYYSSDEQSIS